MALSSTCAAFSNSLMIRKYYTYRLTVCVLTASEHIYSELHNSSAVNLHNLCSLLAALQGITAGVMKVQLREQPSVRTVFTESRGNAFLIGL